MEVPDRVVLLVALLFEDDVSISHCSAPGSPASLYGEGKEHLFSDEGLPILHLILSLKFQDALAVVATRSGYAIRSGRFIESLVDLIEALCLADAYVYLLAISLGKRSIVSCEGAAHMRIWRQCKKERRGAYISRIWYHHDNLHQGVGEPISGRGVPIDQPLQRLLSTTVVTIACQVLL